MHSSKIRQQVMADMKLAGLSVSTQNRYLDVMDRFFRRAWVSPEQVTEQMVRDYLSGEIERGTAYGTFRPTRYGLEFLFQNTLGRDWDLFKKEWPFPSVSDCLGSSAMRSAGSCSPACGIRFIALVCA